MTPSERDTEPTMTSERALAGILALLAADREERAATRAIDSVPIKPPEVVLASAGMSAREIGAVLGKPHEAVRSTLRRDAARKTGGTKATRGNGGDE